MTNKTQLQENNADLDNCIARVNAARDLASNLPDAGTSVEVLLQSKTVTPTKSIQEVTADADYTALEKVTVESIPSEYIIPSGTKTITENGEYDVTEKEKVVVDVESENGSTTYKTCTIKIVNGSPEVSYARVVDGIATCVKNQEIQPHFYVGKKIYDNEEFLLENVLCSSGFELNIEETFPQTAIGVSGGIEVVDAALGQPFFKAPSEDGSVGIIEIFNEELPWG